MQNCKYNSPWAWIFICSLQWGWSWGQRDRHRLLSRVRWWTFIIWNFFQWWCWPVSLLIENRLGSCITDMNYYYTIHIIIFIFSDDNMFQKTDRKYIVSESKLMELFSICPTCSFSTLCQIKKVLGTMIKIDQSCGMCGFQRTWDSQEMIGAIPSGNLSLSAAILFSGSY